MYYYGILMYYYREYIISFTQRFYLELLSFQAFTVAKIESKDRKIFYIR